MGSVKIQNQPAKGIWVNGYAIDRMTVTDTKTGAVNEVVKTFETTDPLNDIYWDDNVSYLYGNMIGDQRWQSAKTQYSGRAIDGILTFDGRYVLSNIMQENSDQTFVVIQLNNNIYCRLYTQYHNQYPLSFGLVMDDEQIYMPIDIPMNGDITVRYTMYYNKTTKQYEGSIVVGSEKQSLTKFMREGFGKMRIGRRIVNNKHIFTVSTTVNHTPAKYTDGINGNDFNIVDPYTNKMIKRTIPYNEAELAAIERHRPLHERMLEDKKKAYESNLRFEKLCQENRERRKR